ncbi:hypothetical protein Tph_c02800 [Thermacetogenium phaeum DSM 12270]|uniref:Uncharacterized protein n=1 Tax=Thermacetogenium phaeum (strain ATCC BAA-254 / DSM 26808 / PB) TaxID=1089553 RepID=K4LEK9_THEPS|nr:hypothetical protein [Thermacetogenium phaeum]AFV10527.1 hypothetical protein Tph_c02800 [Thermacetogenium phaeum DSM 12270]
MLIERYYLERALLFRVPGIAKINSVGEKPYSITVFIGDKNGEILPEVLEIAERVAEEIRPVTSLVAVKPYRDGPGDAVPPAALPEEIKRAAVFTPPTKSDLEYLLKRALDGCIFAEAVTVRGGEIAVYVGGEDGSASADMLEKAEQLLKIIYGNAVKYEICDYRDYSASAGANRSPTPFFIDFRFDPQRYGDGSLLKLAKNDEERYCDLLPKLIDGEADPEKELGCRFVKKGAALVDLGASEGVLEALLTIFSSVYLYLPQDGERFSGSRAATLPFSIKDKTFIRLVNAGRIIPVFHAPLHQYSLNTVIELIEASKGRAVLPRQLDGLTVLTMARQFPFWKTIRRNPGAAAEIYHLLNYQMHDFGDDDFGALVLRSLKQVFENHLLVAERGEQWFLDVGRVAAGTLTAGGLVASFLDDFAQTVDKEVLDTVMIETHGHAVNLTAARALGAVYSPALVINEKILNMVAHLQAGPRRQVSAVSVNQFDEVIKGLHVVRPEHVPLEEYLDVLNSSEAERVRRVVFDVIYRAQGDPQKVKEEVDRLNREVLKWRRSMIGKAADRVIDVIDIVGLVLDKVPIPLGAFGEPVLSFFGMAINALFGDKIKETVDAAVFAALEDRVFAALGGVSPAAVRLSKVRSKIGSKY